MNEDGAPSGVQRSSSSSSSSEPPHGHTPWWCWPVLAFAVFSASSAAVAFSFISDVPPITLAAWRLQLTACIACVAAAVQWRGMPAQHRRRFVADRWWLAFSGAALAAHFGAWVWSLQHTSLAHSVLLVCTAPVILVFVALLLRQPISGGEVAGAVLAVIGCAVLAGGAVTGSEQHVTLVGDAAAFAAAVAIVGHWHAGKRLRAYLPVFVYGGPVTAFAAALLSAAGFAAESRCLLGADHHGVLGWLSSARHAAVVAYLGVVPGIVGHQGFNAVLRYMTPLLVGLAVQVEPVLSPFLGWLAGVSAPPGPYTWAGGALVLLATAGASVATAAREAKEAREARALVKHKSLRNVGDDAQHDADVAADPAAAGTLVALAWKQQQRRCSSSDGSLGGDDVVLDVDAGMRGDERAALLASGASGSSSGAGHVELQGAG